MLLFGPKIGGQDQFHTIGAIEADTCRRLASPNEIKQFVAITLWVRDIGVNNGVARLDD